MKSKISAKIVADTWHPDNQSRLTTFVLTFPRFILAELNTHRVFSRNSASSRAIPFKRMLSMVWNDPFIPHVWLKDHKGMQGSVQLKHTLYRWLFTVLWLRARDCAMIIACLMNTAGLTKQICNRLLEPFMWHTVILSGCEFKNFFSQRCSRYGMAEYHMGLLADAMEREYLFSKPPQHDPNNAIVDLEHIPFYDYCREQYFLQYKNKNYKETHKIETIRKMSVVLCARISYMNFNLENWENTYTKLIEHKHLSPFEHIAFPSFIYGSGNFEKYGFVQFRKSIENNTKN